MKRLWLVRIVALGLVVLVASLGSDMFAIGRMLSSSKFGGGGTLAALLWLRMLNRMSRFVGGRMDGLLGRESLDLWCFLFSYERKGRGAELALLFDVSIRP